jgi:glutathione S-transferase
LELLLDDQLGPHMRRVCYFFLLQKQEYVQHFFDHGCISAWERWLGTHWFTLFRVLISKGLKIDRAGFESSMAKVNKVYDELDGLLADGRTYLCGTRLPSAADISLATLAILMPPEMPACAGYPPMDVKHVGEPLMQIVGSLRARPAGQVRTSFPTACDTQIDKFTLLHRYKSVSSLH